MEGRRPCPLHLCPRAVRTVAFTPGHTALVARPPPCGAHVAQGERVELQTPHDTMNIEGKVRAPQPPSVRAHAHCAALPPGAAALYMCPRALLPRVPTRAAPACAPHTRCSRCRRAGGRALAAPLHAEVEAEVRQESGRAPRAARMHHFSEHYRYDGLRVVQESAHPHTNACKVCTGHGADRCPRNPERGSFDSATRSQHTRAVCMRPRTEHACLLALVRPAVPHAGGRAGGQGGQGGLGTCSVCRAMMPS